MRMSIHRDDMDDYNDWDSTHGVNIKHTQEKPEMLIYSIHHFLILILSQQMTLNQHLCCCQATYMIHVYCSKLDILLILTQLMKAIIGLR